MISQRYALREKRHDCLNYKHFKGVCLCLKNRQPTCSTSDRAFRLQIISMELSWLSSQEERGLAVIMTCDRAPPNLEIFCPYCTQIIEA